MKEFGVQLYSVRDTMNDEAGIRETFRRLREMGYTQVQTAGCEIPFADFGRIAAEEGLQIVGTHEVFDSMYEDFDTALQNLVCRTFTEHSRIVFNGNGYSEAWQKEAAQRGLSNYRATAEALPHYVSQKNIDLVTKHGIFTESEFRARHEIHLEAYCKIMRIEAQTTVDMAMRQILPAVSKYCGDLCARADVKQRLFVTRNAEMDLITQLSEGIDQLYIACDELKKTLSDVPSTSDEGSAYYYRVVSPAMKKVRSIADGLELITDKSYWPFPTYSDILFY
jgi:glutamine synthetase